MENDKYFVPDIEDFRFGYEFEKNYSSSGGDWYPTKIVAYLDFEGLDFYIEEGLLRTPYLTKEQIEAEGWICIGQNSYIDSNFYYFMKSEKSLDFNGITHEIKISDDPYYPDYAGECKDINTFKWLCKLLKIDKQ